MSVDKQSGINEAVSDDCLSETSLTKRTNRLQKTALLLTVSSLAGYTAKQTLSIVIGFIKSQYLGHLQWRYQSSASYPI